MAKTFKTVDDVAIYDLSENSLSPLFKVGSVMLFSREEAEAKGRMIAQRRGVTLWMQRGLEVQRVASYRKELPRLLQKSRAGGKR